MKPKVIVLISLLVLFFIFVLQNISSVTVSFLVFDMSMPRALLLLITFALGLLVGIFIPFEFKRQK